MGLRMEVNTSHREEKVNGLAVEGTVQSRQQA